MTDVIHLNFLFQLTVQNNRLIRMAQVSKLSHLKILNLAGNHISVMEGLKELKLLTWFDLFSHFIIHIVGTYGKFDIAEIKGRFAKITFGPKTFRLSQFA